MGIALVEATGSATVEATDEGAARSFLVVCGEIGSGLILGGRLAGTAADGTELRRCRFRAVELNSRVRLRVSCSPYLPVRLAGSRVLFHLSESSHEKGMD